ncbi:unnamed protein product [Calypogeia fissa]
MGLQYLLDLPWAVTRSSLILDLLLGQPAVRKKSIRVPVAVAAPVAETIVEHPLEGVTPDPVSREGFPPAPVRHGPLSEHHLLGRLMEILCCSRDPIIDEVLRLQVAAVTVPAPHSPTPKYVPPEEEFIHVPHPHAEIIHPYVDLCDGPTWPDFDSLPPTPARPSLSLEEYQHSISPENVGTGFIIVEHDAIYSPTSGLGSGIGVVPPVESEADETLQPVIAGLPYSATPEIVHVEEDFDHVPYPHVQTVEHSVDVCDCPTLGGCDSLSPTLARPCIGLDECQQQPVSPHNASTSPMSVDDDVMYSPASSVGSDFGVVPPVDTGAEERIESVCGEFPLGVELHDVSDCAPSTDDHRAMSPEEELKGGDPDLSPNPPPTTDDHGRISPEVEVTGCATGVSPDPAPVLLLLPWTDTAGDVGDEADGGATHPNSPTDGAETCHVAEEEAHGRTHDASGQPDPTFADAPMRMMPMHVEPLQSQTPIDTPLNMISPGMWRSEFEKRIIWDYSVKNKPLVAPVPEEKVDGVCVPYIPTYAALPYNLTHVCLPIEKVDNVTLPLNSVEEHSQPGYNVPLACLKCPLQSASKAGRTVWLHNFSTVEARFAAFVSDLDD